MKAYTKDILRTIKKEWKRFVAIAVIAALGVTMFTGLKASCDDLTYSVDNFFNEQNLHDIYIRSTLGLTDKDINTLKKDKTIKDVTGFFSETVHLKVNDVNHTAEMKMVTDMDRPYVVEGRLPVNDHEIAVNSKYLHEADAKIGDKIVIDQDEDHFKHTSYKICGSIIDPTDINATEGSTSFRSSATTDYLFFVHPKAVDSDIYTAVGLTLKDESLKSFTDDYNQSVTKATSVLVSDYKSKMERRREEDVKNEALKKIKKKEKKAKKSFKKAEKKFKKAKKKLKKAKKSLKKAQRTLNSNKKKAKREFAKAKRLISNGFKQIKKARRQLKSQKKKLKSQKKKLVTNKKKAKTGLNTINTNLTKVNGGIAQIKTQLSTVPEEYQAPLKAQLTELEKNQKLLKTQKAKTQKSLKTINKYLSQIRTGYRKIKQAYRTLKTQKKKLQQAKKTLAVQIKKANKQFSDGQRKINKGKVDLQKGIRKYNKNYKKYLKEKKKALKKIADAKDDLKDIEAAWYITDRNNLSSYNNIESDTGAIESLGYLVSVIFLVVAVLICLTTVNRMVEEDRGLIGTYQALGMSDREIRSKYMAYALSAGILGGIIGNIGGFVGLPAFIFLIFGVMYQIPILNMRYNFIQGLGGSLLFIAAVALAVYFTCHSSLKQEPATLMRPKAPKPGSRVLLERITPIWKRLSFLNKVTIRNLFRYKKRLLMTIVGIAGCTGLLLFGFSIRDSVGDLMMKQYDQINRYDWLCVTDSDDHKALKKKVTHNSKSLDLAIHSVTLEKDKKTMSLQLYVIPDNEDISEFISIRDSKTGEKLMISDKGLILTKNATVILDINQDDTVKIRDLEFREHDYKVINIAENYLGNTIYMSKKLYNKTFHDHKDNALLVTFNKDIDKKTLIKKIEQDDKIISSMSTQSLKDSFETSFMLINDVVYIIIGMSAALAFVVLFTLATINISERERELATIKVLGFFDPEVHMYVYKETTILTIVGILLGLPFGVMMANALTPLLKMPSLYFAVSIHQISYVCSIALSLLFAFIVNVLTSRALNKIDPVEALKSIE